jgi:uncharacterized protein (TIGR03437 family)
LLRQSAADITTTPTSLAWDGENLYVADPSNRRVLVFTAAEPLIPINGVRNAASREIFALGAVTVIPQVGSDGTPTITANDEVTVTINGKEYKYKVVKEDTIESILEGLERVINAGEGDKFVFAQVEHTLLLLKLIARKGGTEGNDITISATVSEKATLRAQSSGAALQGGQNATVVAPGTIVMILGQNLADAPVAADLSKQLPLELGGVQVYFDGIRSPITYVSPTQINAQIPYEVLDSNNISAYARIQHADGRVTVTNAIAVPIDQQNPGLFAEEGEDPRLAVAFHSSSHATGTILIDGIPTKDNVATVKIDDRSYNYTVLEGDTLNSIRDGLIAAINANPEERVVASAAGAFSRIRLRARIPGPEGNDIKLAIASSDGSTVVLTPTNTHMCCANIAGARVTEQNPAVPGEVIQFWATGLGLVAPDEARQGILPGGVYVGPEVNSAREFVSSQIGGSTANVIQAGLKPGVIGLYEVLLEINSGVPSNPRAQVTISQNIYTSNIVTIPIANPEDSFPFIPTQ